MSGTVPNGPNLGRRSLGDATAAGLAAIARIGVSEDQAGARRVSSSFPGVADIDAVGKSKDVSIIRRHRAQGIVVNIVEIGDDGAGGSAPWNEEAVYRFCPAIIRQPQVQVGIGVIVVPDISGDHRKVHGEPIGAIRIVAPPTGNGAVIIQGD